jgi:hypothetical protein
VKLKGGTADCAVSNTGVVLFVAAAYCGEDAPCAATWVSLDGVTFTAATPYTPQGSGNLAALAADASGSFYAMDGKNNVMKTIDNAQTWQQLGQIPEDKSTVTAITIGGDGTMYAATPTGAGVPNGMDGRFFVSKDSGYVWVKAPVAWVAGGQGSGHVGLATVLIEL